MPDLGTYYSAHSTYMISASNMILASDLTYIARPGAELPVMVHTRGEELN